MMPVSAINVLAIVNKIHQYYYIYYMMIQ
jgi:hypothetical protein